MRWCPPRTNSSVGTLRAVEFRGDALQGGQREIAVLVRRQQPAPGIEQLHGIRAGIHLGQQQIRDHVGDGVQRPLRQCRIPMHERARFAEIFAAAAFDAVGEQREGRAREAQDAVAILQRLLEMRHGARQIVDAPQHAIELPGVVVGGGAQGFGDARALAGTEADAEAHGQRHHENVGEHDGRIERVAIERLERGARRQFRFLAHVPEAVLGAQCAISRQVTSCLAHEPHRRAVERIATQRREKSLTRMHRTQTPVKSTMSVRPTSAPLSQLCHGWCRVAKWGKLRGTT